jgi:hypothetical protein
MSPNCCPPFSFHHSNPNPLIQSLRVRCPSPQPPSHPRPPPKQRESDGRDREAPARTSTHSHMCAHAHAHVHTHTHKDSRGTYMHPPSTQNDHTRQRQHAPAPPSSSSPSGAAPFACVLRPVHTRIPRRTTSPLWRHTSLRYVLRDCPRSSRSSWLTKASVVADQTTEVVCTSAQFCTIRDDGTTKFSPVLQSLGPESRSGSSSFTASARINLDLHPQIIHDGVILGRLGNVGASV